ncbi:MAG: DUF934 domain-containing protein [Porticoccaceae bacterium]
MPRLLRETGFVDDTYQLLPKDFAGQLPSRPLVPLRYWLDNRDHLRELPGVGVWLESDEEPAALAADIAVIACIGVNFPTFMDGRGFSTARLLRERYGFRGELRAIGHIIPDQLFFLKRCGFDSFQLADEPSLDSLRDQVNAFSVNYQADADSLPLFRRRPA